MAETLRGEILIHLCRNREYILMILGLLGVFLLLTIVGFTVISPGTPTYVINVMNILGLALCFAIFSVIAIYCYRITPGRAHQ